MHLFCVRCRSVAGSGLLGFGSSAHNAAELDHPRGVGSQRSNNKALEFWQTVQQQVSTPSAKSEFHFNGARRVAVTDLSGSSAYKTSSRHNGVV